MDQTTLWDAEDASRRLGELRRLMALVREAEADYQESAELKRQKAERVKLARAKLNAYLDADTRPLPLFDRVLPVAPPPSTAPPVPVPPPDRPAGVPSPNGTPPRPGEHPGRQDVVLAQMRGEPSPDPASELISPQEKAAWETVAVECPLGRDRFVHQAGRYVHYHFPGGLGLACHHKDSRVEDGWEPSPAQQTAWLAGMGAPRLTEPPAGGLFSELARQPKLPSAAVVEEVVAAHPGMLVLFRLGERYEFLHEPHANQAAEVGVPRAFEQTLLEQYLQQLVHAGQRVAICEQVGSAPGTAKVERITTPGEVRSQEPGSLDHVRWDQRCEFLVYLADGLAVGCTWDPDDPASAKGVDNCVLTLRGEAISPTGYLRRVVIEQFRTVPLLDFARDLAQGEADKQAARATQPQEKPKEPRRAKKVKKADALPAKED